MLLHKKFVTMIFLFCRAITTQNKPGRLKTKHRRLILMLVWKNRQQQNHESALPSRGEVCVAGHSPPFDGSKRKKGGKYTRSHGVFLLSLNPYHQLQISLYLYQEIQHFRVVKSFITCTRIASFVTIPCIQVQFSNEVCTTTSGSTHACA